ncbi:cysteine desulfurase family protein [Planctomicrobium sp. SH661]|uniref:cysteine desulfurase family protein n=1 Tax=Planctomicrobium sp. SH661 TaxID=3448124 RepID=UPI003F5BB751
MIYLDNNATTPLDPEVLDEMNRVAQVAWGNPGSRHLAGRKARQVLEDSREAIAQILQAAPDEVIFTSGGTESSNLAISGLAVAEQGTILLPPGEHPATEEPVRRLINSGWKRKVLPIDVSGRLDPLGLQNLSLEGVSLATSLLAHNETGVIQDLKPLALRCLEHRIPLHVDAVQAVGKIDVSFRDLPATTLSAAAHKFHGPRGIGVLLVRKGARLRPVLLGGYQEQGMRPGTEPVVLAAGMSFALRKWHRDREARTATLTNLRDRLQAGLLAACSPAIVNGDQGSRLPNTLHMSFPGCDGDALLIALDLAGICCSLGSACASGSTEPSPVLLGMGLSKEVALSSLRLSISVWNTPAEIDEAVSKIAAAVRRLRTWKSTT